MIIGIVVGTVVATRKTDNIEGLPLRVVRRLTITGDETDAHVIAADVIGADEGEVVLLAAGSSARQTHLTDKRPVDAVIMAIVDTWQVAGVIQYDKHIDQLIERQ